MTQPKPAHTPKFTVSQQVTWSSQAGGRYKEKRGTIVAILEPWSSHPTDPLHLHAMNAEIVLAKLNFGTSNKIKLHGNKTSMHRRYLIEVPPEKNSKVVNYYVPNCKSLDKLGFVSVPVKEYATWEVTKPLTPVLTELAPIRTEADHKVALAEITRLWNASPGTPDFEKFEILATLVDAYERRNNPILPPNQDEAIKFRLEQSRKLPVEKSSKKQKVKEVLSTFNELSAPMLRPPSTHMSREQFNQFMKNNAVDSNLSLVSGHNPNWTPREPVFFDPIDYKVIDKAWIKK